MTSARNITSLELKDMMRDAARGLNKDLADALNLYAREIKRNVTRGEGLEKLNERYAAQARNRAAAHFKQTRTRLSGDYRSGDSGRWKRYSGGKLEAAIRSPAVTYSSREGITFFDMGQLDALAPQWYRLNFGTKSRPGKAPQAQPMSFFGSRGSTRLSADRFGPSKDFKIPRGFWSSARFAKTRGSQLTAPQGKGLDAFYPAKLKPKPSQNTSLFKGKRKASIKGTRFLDEGIKYVNTYYPRSFEALVRKWMRGGK